MTKAQETLNRHKAHLLALFRRYPMGRKFDVKYLGFHLANAEGKGGQEEATQRQKANHALKALHAEGLVGWRHVFVGNPSQYAWGASQYRKEWFLTQKGKTNNPEG